MKLKNKPRIGILGLGVVGTQFKRWFEEKKKYKNGINLFLYDINPSKKYFDDINKAEIIFISVPTPSLPDGSIDLSLIESAFKGLTGKKIIIIKSTVLPGTTEYFQKKYKQHKILFSPEFLTETNAWNDVYKPKRQIVGFTKNDVGIAQMVLSLLPKAPFMSPSGINTSKQIKITATEAEIIKYGGNIFLSRKINLANILNILSEKIGANYNNVRLGIGADHRIGNSHLDVLHGGYKGFGGCCIPKDLNAFIACLDYYNLLDSADLLKKDREFNEKLLLSQGMTIKDVSICTFSKKTKTHKILDGKTSCNSRKKARSVAK
jgi:UDPglucose 6-dehydrogenase